MGITLLGTGSRSLSKRLDQNLIVDQAFRSFLRECRDYGLSDEIKLFKHGAAPGADMLMEQWCRDNSIKFLAFPAKWNDWKVLPRSRIKLKQRPDGSTYNALAGFNRNEKMIESGFDAGLAIRMPGHSPGTDDDIERIKAVGKPVMIYHVDGRHEWL